jgi:cell division protein FtsQ
VVAPVVSTSTATADLPASRRSSKRRRASNRRVSIQRRPPVVVVAEGLQSAGRAVFTVLRVLAKLLVLVGLLVAVVGGGRVVAAHVVASPQFALAAVEVRGVARAGRSEILAATGVKLGDALLALDTDKLAARIAEHPWVAEARVGRRLPATLVIDVVERRARAAVNLGGLYLVDGEGHPFKRATAAEAVGLPVITGIERPQYVDHRGPCEAAFREALTIVTAWARKPGRPPLSEVNVAPRHGFTVFLADTGAEIRLGRNEYDRKLARLDQILEAVKASGAGVGTVRVVHLDGEGGNRVPVHLTLEGTLPTISK